MAGFIGRVQSASEDARVGAMRRTPLAALLGVLLAVVFAAPVVRAQTLPTGFVDEQLVPGLNFPTSFEFLPDGRVLFVEQTSFRVRMIQGGALSIVDPVLTVPEVRPGPERGLLGIAVDPRWPAEPYLYVHSTSTTGRIRISRFRVSGDLDGTAGTGLSADPASRMDLIDDIPDAQFNHNGGTVRFGPDQLMYVTLGEDAVPCAAQDTVSLRGVVLRIEVRLIPDGPGRATRAQITPASNPYALHPDTNARLVAVSGLRNPFRLQIDPVRRWLLIGDVGQVTHEELDVVRLPGSTGTLGGTLGADFGWPWFEGPAPFSTCTGSSAGRIAPSYSYDRSGAGSASIMVAGAYRPQAAAADWPAEYHGDVFMSDYYSGVLRRLRVSGNAFAVAPAVAGQPSATNWAIGFAAASDYRVGSDGSFWYLRQAVNFQPNSGSLRRIVFVGDTLPPPPPPPPPAPGEFALQLLVAPQPAIGTATISITPTSRARISVRIHDLTGRVVRTLLEGSDRAAGRHDLFWDGLEDSGREAPAGIYVVRADTEQLSRSHRLVLIR